MWYSHFNKETWQLRLWRKQNLKFNQDDLGMYRVKYLSRWKEIVFRLCRSEAALRGCGVIIMIGTIPILFHVKTAYYDPAYVVPKQKEDTEKLKVIDAEAREILFYNRFGAPTRPMRSMDEMMKFLSGNETYDDLLDFVSYSTASDINSDQGKGLDSIMSSQDRLMLQKFKESKGASH